MVEGRPPLIDHLLENRRAAVVRSDWGLVRELDHYLHRLGYREPVEVVETAEERVQPEDTAEARPARNSRR